MSEYISKDDAQVLIDILNTKTYSLKEAKLYLSILSRLQAYIDNPEELQVEAVKK